MMNNFCSNCGNKLNIGETHCGMCGRYLGNNNTTNNVYYDNRTQNDLNKATKSKKYARISMILALIPVILIVFCYIKSLGSFDESGAGGIWWLMILYFMTIGIPVAFASIIFGIVSLSYKKNTLAIVSIFIVLFPLIFSLFLSWV